MKKLPEIKIEMEINYGGPESWEETYWHVYADGKHVSRHFRRCDAVEWVNETYAKKEHTKRIKAWKKAQEEFKKAEINLKQKRREAHSLIVGRVREKPTRKYSVLLR